MSNVKITDATEEDFIRLKPQMRSRDYDILKKIGMDPDKELRGTWDAATSRKLVSRHDGYPLGILLSMYPYINEQHSLWSLITFTQLDRERLSFVKYTREAIRELMKFEPEQVTSILTCLPLEFTESVNWHERIAKARRAMEFDFNGIRHVMFELRREWY